MSKVEVLIEGSHLIGSSLSSQISIVTGLNIGGKRQGYLMAMDRLLPDRYYKNLSGVAG